MLKQTMRWLSAGFAAALLLAGSARAAEWFPYKAEAVNPPFAADGKASMVEYVPLAKASKKWDICVSFPHMKDAYWLGVDYGVVEEAKRQGVKMQLVEAGGYTNLNKQISQIEDCVARGANAVVMLKAVDDPSAFGIAEVDGERIVRLVEKPKHPTSNLAIVGGYVFDHNIFESTRRIKPSWRNEFEITDAIQNLIDRGLNVVPYVVHGWWKDTGKPGDILDANRVLLDMLTPAVRGKVDAESRLDGTVVIGEGAEVINSTIRGPVIIGSEARLVDAQVGPYVSLGDRVHVIDARIENSVVMDDSLLEHVPQPIAGSLIGRQVKITGSAAAAPATLRLLLGDFCETELP